jgi:hypothetical protein
MADRRESAASLVRSLASQGMPSDSLIQELRSRGYAMGESSVALSEGLSIGLDVAQRMIVESEVWADFQLTQAAAQDAFMKAIEEIGERREDGSIEINLSELD